MNFEHNYEFIVASFLRKNMRAIYCYTLHNNA